MACVQEIIAVDCFCYTFCSCARPAVRQASLVPKGAMHGDTRTRVRNSPGTKRPGVPPVQLQTIHAPPSAAALPPSPPPPPSSPSLPPHAPGPRSSPHWMLRRHRAPAMPGHGTAPAAAAVPYTRPSSWPSRTGARNVGRGSKAVTGVCSSLVTSRRTAFQAPPKRN